MKIAYICADRDIPVFGCKSDSFHIQEMIQAFARNHHVSVFARNSGGETPCALRGVEFKQLPRLKSKDSTELEQHALKSNRSIAGMIKDLGMFDLVYERFTPFSYGALESARETAAITVLEVNEALLEKSPVHDVQAADEACRRAFEAADVIVAISRQLADYLAGFSETHDKVHIIPPGISYDRYRPYMPRVPKSLKPLTLGYLGSLKSGRGVELILQAYARIMRKIPNSRVRIIGDGPQRPQLESLCSELGIQNRVQFTGAIEPYEIPHQLGEMDIGLAPYHKTTEDSVHDCISALKIRQYMASGLPVIASDMGQLNNMIEHLKTGVLVEPGSIDALAQAVIWLHRNPALSTRLAEQAQQISLAEHTWTAIAQRVLELSGFNESLISRRLVL